MESLLKCSYCNTNNLSTFMYMEYYNPPSTPTTKLVNAKSSKPSVRNTTRALHHIDLISKNKYEIQLHSQFYLGKYVNDQSPTHHILPILSTFTLPFPG